MADSSPFAFHHRELARLHAQTLADQQGLETGLRQAEERWASREETLLAQTTRCAASSVSAYRRCMCSRWQYVYDSASFVRPCMESPEHVRLRR